MAAKLPIAKLPHKVSELLRAGQPFLITAKTVLIPIYEHTNEQLELLRDILKDNTTVVTLDITIGKNDADRSFQLISDILQTNKSIDSLMLQGHSINDEYMKTLFIGLSQNKTIKKIVVHSRFGSQGFYYLSELLKISSTLSYINIHYDGDIDSQSIKYLSTALKINSSLRTLILRARVKSVDILGEALLYNTTLRLLQFNFQSQEVTDEEVESFCRSIERNVGLETLTMHAPSIYTHRILKSFTINNTVSNLGLTSYGSKLDLTADDESWIREIKGLTYVDGAHEILDRVLLDNKRVIKHRREDLKILLFNIARSATALELFPIEIWQHIFKFLVYPGIYVGDLAEIIFPKAWTLDFTVDKKNNIVSQNNAIHNNNTRNNDNSSSKSSKLCVLL